MVTGLSHNLNPIILNQNFLNELGCFRYQTRFKLKLQEPINSSHHSAREHCPHFVSGSQILMWLGTFLLDWYEPLTRRVTPPTIGFLVPSRRSSYTPPDPVLCIENYCKISVGIGPTILVAMVATCQERKSYDHIPTVSTHNTGPQLSTQPINPPTKHSERNVLLFCSYHSRQLLWLIIYPYHTNSDTTQL